MPTDEGTISERDSERVPAVLAEVRNHVGCQWLEYTSRSDICEGLDLIHLLHEN